MTDQEIEKPIARRVVVAEDESLIRMDIVEILRDNGFDVVGEAADGEAAVALALELRPDLVIMDVKMPKMDGITAADKLNKEHVAPVFTPNDLLPAIEIALSRWAQIVALENEVSDLSERFETRKIVDIAKGILNEKMGLTEPEAFRWIQKASMDRRLTMKDVAVTIVDQLGSKK